MRIEKFKRASDESLVIIYCEIPNHKMALAIDTGASYTTVDLTALLIAGFEIKDSLRIESHLFRACRASKSFPPRNAHEP